MHLSFHFDACYPEIQQNTGASIESSTYSTIPFIETDSQSRDFWIHKIGFWIFMDDTALDVEEQI